MKILRNFILFAFLASCATGQQSQSKKEKISDIYLEAGTESLMNGEYTEALKSLLQAVKENPKSNEAWNNLGLAYIAKKQPTKAEDAFKKALEIDNNFSDARNNLGLLYMSQNKFKLAEDTFKTVADDLTYEKAHQANYNLGLLYEKQNKLTKAEQQYRLVVNTNATYCPAWYKLGKILKDRGEFSEAEAAFKHSITGTCYRNPEAHYEIGNLYLKNNEVSKAKEKFLEVIEFFPKTDWAQKAELTLNMIH